jgi:formylglycine-generating enzyme required for sulfatase activity
MGLVKGGGYRTTPKVAILSARHKVPADMRNPTFGFRCVKPHLGK